MSYPYKSKTLENLGVRSWINASNWSTTYGGNWIDDRVLESMNEVAKTFVDMQELMVRAGERISELCKVDAAYVTCGAAAAIELAVAACIAKRDIKVWKALPKIDEFKNEVTLPLGHHISYQAQWKACGSNVVGYGSTDSLDKITLAEIESAVSLKTSCMGYVESYNVMPRGVLPLTDVVKVARKHDLPVIVDAAGMLPPTNNLQKYLDLGADIVIFSGGKGIKGPNNTGMLLGQGLKGKEIINALLEYSFPNYGWARSHKVSKEQVVGLLTALEIFIEEADDYYKKQMDIANKIASELSKVPFLKTCVIPNDEIFREHPVMPRVPRVKIEWDLKNINLTSSELDEAIAENDPPIILRGIHYYSYYTNNPWRLIDTYFLRDGEEDVIIDRVKKLFNDHIK